MDSSRVADKEISTDAVKTPGKTPLQEMLDRMEASPSFGSNAMLLYSKSRSQCVG